MVAAASATLMVMFAASALAAPPAMTLSSFEATSTDGVIDGGTRTISVTNFGAETLTAHAVELGEAPCDCVVSSVSGGIGSIENGVWSVGDLAPGASAEITFTYGRDAALATAPVPIDVGTISMILLALMSALVVAVFARRNPHTGLAIQI